MDLPPMNKDGTCDPFIRLVKRYQFSSTDSVSVEELIQFSIGMRAWMQGGKMVAYRYLQISRRYQSRYLRAHTCFPNRLQLGNVTKETRVIQSALKPKWRENFEFLYRANSGSTIVVSINTFNLIIIHFGFYSKIIIFINSNFQYV